MELVSLENLSDVEQHVWDSANVRHSIPAKSIVNRRSDLAELFLKQSSKYVRKYVAAIIPDVPGESKRWVANVTGNPALPKELTFKQTDRKTGLDAWLKKPNPLAIPTTINHKMQRGQERGLDGEGKETAYNLPALRIKFPAATRHPVSVSIANWLINEMDAMQDEDAVGRLVYCRAPTAFEPNESWEYEDIRLYVTLMGSVPLDLKKTFPPATQLKTGADVKKEELLHALFFYIIDERYALPPQEAFEAAKVARDSTKNKVEA